MEKKKIFELSLFIFRRDLRLVDNSGLNLAMERSNKIMPVFFLDNRQVDKTNNPYYSSNSIQFMLQSISNLSFHLNKHKSELLLINGDLQKNFEILLTTSKINAVFVNEDYSPFSITRDNQLKEICYKHNVEFFTCEDTLLTNLHKVKLSSSGAFYKKYTPYYNAASQIEVNEPKTFENSKFLEVEKSEENKKIFKEIKKTFSENKVKFFDFNENKNSDNSEENFVLEIMKELKMKFNPKVEIKGGRDRGEEKLKEIKKHKNYKDERNFPIISSTRLSAYIKFGNVSVREVFKLIKSNFSMQHDLIKQLHWRDFYIKIMFFFPRVIGDAMKPEYSKLKWQAEEKHIELWKEGNTGFPIVDAGMRCLNETGFMHNRLRMIVSSFLCKDILADWKIGEKYFANKLIDYDIALNNGGWQWSSSSGTDSQPYFRIFNPALQSEKFDKDCEFILKWIPELKKCSKKHIHNWEIFGKEYKDKVDYPQCIFSHAEQKEKALKMYKKLYEDRDEKEKEKKLEDDDDDVSSSEDEVIVSKSNKRSASASESVTKGKKKAVKDNNVKILDSFAKGKNKKK